ncbi:HAD family hydrolase [Kytococcus schroeteri]|nr:beta-phosphoglucomutase family hydrolase [Kytococcus schroeteri]
MDRTPLARPHVDAEVGAVLFDLDGVLTPTAEVHRRAWHRLFTDYLTERTRTTGEQLAPYTNTDYYEHVDGKPRLDGVRDLLASRGIALPEAEVEALGARKNEAFLAELEAGVEPYPGSLALLEHLAAVGTPMAVVSSSANAPAVLRTAGIDHFFPVVVDGAVAREEGLPGKPAPDTFEAAAERLGVPSDRAVVVEDATSGVAAGAAGDFAAVVGVDRGAGAEALRAAGATAVVTDLEELLP